MQTLTNYDHLLLYNLVEGIGAPEQAFASQLADVLTKYRHIVRKTGVAPDFPLRTAASILRNEAPLYLNHVCLCAADSRIGYFRIELVAEEGSPFTVYVENRIMGRTKAASRMGTRGYVLSTFGHHLVDMSRNDYKVAIRVIDLILARDGYFSPMAWIHDETDRIDFISRIQPQILGEIAPKRELVPESQGGR